MILSTDKKFTIVTIWIFVSILCFFSVQSAPTVSETNSNNNNTLYSIDLIPSSIDAEEECNKKTGWSSYHIDSSLHYNDGCSVICVIKGHEYSHAIRENAPCFDHEHICHHGSCYLKSKVPQSSDEVYTHISIKGAYVRDADPWPMQGKSDAFAVVELLDGTNRGIICHTRTIQDDNLPQWNHQCKSNPMKLDSKLEFAIYDSDKPAERPDRLGSARVQLSSIINKGWRRLYLSGTAGAKPGTYIEVSVRDDKNP